MVIFYTIYTFYLNTTFWIPLCIISTTLLLTNPIIKAFQCDCLLTVSVLGRHFSTQHFVIFSPENNVWLFMQMNIAYFLGKSDHRCAVYNKLA